MKKILGILPVIALLVAGTASAHVTVKPGEVGIGSFQTFVVSVPSEKDMPTTGVRLVIPEGLEHVSPTVKPGWNINLVQDGSGDHGNVVREIIWTGGSIPAHFRDEFTFSAKVPGQESALLWKAYQTYRDGSVVAWELAPNQEQPKNEDGSSDFSQFGPASQTKIVDDLTGSADDQQPQNQQPTKRYDDSLFLSLIALAVSIVAVFLAKKR